MHPIYMIVVVAAFCSYQVQGISLYKTSEEQHGSLLQLKTEQEALISSIQLSQSGEDTSTIDHLSDVSMRDGDNSSNTTVTHENEVYVDAGELVILTGNMTADHQQDALASTLFGQLAADYKHKRTTDYKQWISTYRKVLGQIGWVLVKGSEQNIKVDDYFVVSEILLQLIDGEFNQTAEEEVVQDLKLTLNGFDVHKEAAKVFYNKTYSPSGINVAVNVFNEGEDGSVTMFSTRAFLSVCEASNPYLFHLFEPSCVGGRVHVEFERYRLNEGTYSNVRDIIVQKLGSRMKEYVIKISPLDT